MKKLLIFLLSALSLTAFAQQKKVAVYVTGEQSGVSKVLGDQLVAAFAKSGKYTAVERTSSFLAELSKEQGYQRSGAVNDRDIARLGVQFGVNYVCVADMSDVFGEKYISARLINVETAEIVNTHNVSGEMNNMSSLLKMAGEIAENLSKGSFAEQAADAKAKAEEEARLKAEEEQRRTEIEQKRIKEEKERKEQVIRQQYNAGYIKLGSLYVTTTLASTRSWADVKNMSKNCQIGGWNDWRFPTDSEAEWIRYCLKGGNGMYDDVKSYLMYKQGAQYQDYFIKCMWTNKGSISSANGFGCDGSVRVILVRGYK